MSVDDTDVQLASTSQDTNTVLAGNGGTNLITKEEKGKGGQHDEWHVTLMAQPQEENERRAQYEEETKRANSTHLSGELAVLDKEDLEVL